MIVEFGQKLEFETTNSIGAPPGPLMFDIFSLIWCYYLADTEGGALKMEREIRKRASCKMSIQYQSH